jgi:hypothetical protein
MILITDGRLFLPVQGVVERFKRPCEVMERAQAESQSRSIKTRGHGGVGCRCLSQTQLYDFELALQSHLKPYRDNSRVSNFKKLQQPTEQPEEQCMATKAYFY